MKTTVHCCQNVSHYCVITFGFLLWPIPGPYLEFKSPLTPSLAWPPLCSAHRPASHPLSRTLTFMLPSADPLTKKLSQGLTARLLMPDSWAWNVCRIFLCRKSKRAISPLLLPEMIVCCRGQYIMQGQPPSWHENAVHKEK